MFNPKILEKMKAIHSGYGKMKEYLSGEVLDFGCGDGLNSGEVARMPYVSKVFAYDIDSSRFIRNSGVEFIDRDGLVSSGYDSALASFVVHEAGGEIFI